MTPLDTAFRCFATQASVKALQGVSLRYAADDLAAYPISFGQHWRFQRLAHFIIPECRFWNRPHQSPNAAFTECWSRIHKKITAPKPGAHLADASISFAAAAGCKASRSQAHDPVPPRG